MAGLVANPDIRLGFYTSMKEENAVPAIAALAGPDWEQKVVVYDRNFQKEDPTGEKAWDTMAGDHTHFRTISFGFSLWLLVHFYWIALPPPDKGPHLVAAICHCLPPRWAEA